MEVEIIDINFRLIVVLEKDGCVFIIGIKLNDDFVLCVCLINYCK